MKKQEINKEAAKMAKTIALLCVRNTYLEEIHSKGLILDDEQMKVLMKDIVNHLYKFFSNMDNEEYMKKSFDYASRCTYMWDEPDIE